MTRTHSILFMLEICISLSIVFGANLYHGYESYEKYFNKHINDELLKPVIQRFFPESIAEESYYNRNHDARQDIRSHFTGIPLSKKYAKSEKFVFPDEKFEVSRIDEDNTEILFPITRCSINQTFCENVPNYPTNFINRVLSKNSSLMHYAHEDIIAIVSRADTVDEETLCLSTERIIRPKAGVNIQNRWLYILQSNQSNFHQSVRVETCQEVNTRCKLIDDFAEGYVTTCKQKYIYRELSAISENGEIVRDYFRFPASCCCHVQFQVNGGNPE